MFFKIDQTILDEFPFAFAIDPIQNRKFCGFCFQKTKVTECPSCEHIFYCSRKCERDDLLHKEECLAFKNCSKNENNKDLLKIDLLRLYLRILVKIKMNNDPFELARFKNLTDEYENIINDKERMNQLMYLKIGIGIIMGNAFLKEFTEEDLVSIFGKMVIHKIDIKAETISIGFAVYLEAAKLKHSCEPNSTIFFCGSKIIIKANRLISQNELPTISLCESNLSDLERKAYLKKKIYFDCNCEKCTGSKAIKAFIPSLKFNEQSTTNPELNLAIRIANKFCETLLAKCVFAQFEIDAKTSMDNIYKTKVLFKARPTSDKKYISAWTYRESDLYTIYINEIFKKRLDILNENAEENIEEIETITFYMVVLILHELAHLLFRWKDAKVSPEKIGEAGTKLEDWLFGGKVHILAHPASNWTLNSKYYGIRIKKLVTNQKYSRLSYLEYINKVCHFRPDQDFEIFTTLICDDKKNEIDTLTLKACDQSAEKNSQEEDPDIDDDDIYEQMFRKCLFH